ncbi:MAG: hypothetical protein ACE1YZ_05160, partial [Nitrosopumilaceae archaeon]
AVSTLALLVAGYAVISGNNIQTPTVEINNNSNELKAMQATIDQLTAKIETLEADTANELETIKTKFEQAIETANSEIAQFGISLDQSVYSIGDSIKVTADNIGAQIPVQIELLSYSGEVIASSIPYSDAAGKLVHSIKLPSFIQEGTYEIQATSNDRTVVKSITVSDSDLQTLEESSTIPAGLTVNLDKETYKPGEIIRISGTGQPSQSVSLKITDPDGSLTSAYSSSSSDGSITMVYILPSDADDGNWKMTIKLNDKKETLTFQVT